MKNIKFDRGKIWEPFFALLPASTFSENRTRFVNFFAQLLQVVCPCLVLPGLPGYSALKDLAVEGVVETSIHLSEPILG